MIGVQAALICHQYWECKTHLPLARVAGPSQACQVPSSWAPLLLSQSNTTSQSNSSSSTNPHSPVGIISHYTTGHKDRWIEQLLWLGLQEDPPIYLLTIFLSNAPAGGWDNWRLAAMHQLLTLEQSQGNPGCSNCPIWPSSTQAWRVVGFPSRHKYRRNCSNLIIFV